MASGKSARLSQDCISAAGVRIGELVADTAAEGNHADGKQTASTENDTGCKSTLLNNAALQSDFSIMLAPSSRLSSLDVGIRTRDVNLEL